MQQGRQAEGDGFKIPLEMQGGVDVRILNHPRRAFGGVHTGVYRADGCEVIISNQQQPAED